MQSRQSRKSSTTSKRTKAISISSHTVHLHERFGVKHARAISRINRITQHEVLGRCPWASLHLRNSNSKGRSKKLKPDHVFELDRTRKGCSGGRNTATLSPRA